MLDQSRPRSDSPLLNDENAFKLAVFGVNVERGCTMTSAEGTIEVDWSESVRIAKLADAAGLDALIPVARWKGFGGDTNFNDRSFETFTWAAGLGALTNRIQVISTVHIPTLHPVRAAKEAATVDHISGGRFGLNVVAGWNASEISMFSTTQREHDERYAVAQEWLELAKRLWTEDKFDFEGAFYNAPGAHSAPRPVQSPYPVIISAGASETGLDFAAKHADINFIQAIDIEASREKALRAKEYARSRYGRELKVMGMGYIVCADTEEEAKKYFNYYVEEKGDWNGVRNMMSGLAGNNMAMDWKQRQAAINIIAGYSAQPLIGTPEQIVAGMKSMSDAGLDGITLTWVNYEAGIEQFRHKILPLLVEAGLRRPLV